MYNIYIYIRRDSTEILSYLCCSFVCLGAGVTAVESLLQEDDVNITAIYRKAGVISHSTKSRTKYLFLFLVFKVLKLVDGDW